jgi:hypothetical protein
MTLFCIFWQLTNQSRINSFSIDTSMPDEDEDDDDDDIDYMADGEDEVASWLSFSKCR